MTSSCLKLANQDLRVRIKIIIVLKKFIYSVFFSGFYKDEFTTLQEVTDRILCTDIYCKYWYTPGNLEVDHNNVW